MRSVHIFWRNNQAEKLSDIKPPLCNFEFSSIVPKYTYQLFLWCLVESVWNLRVTHTYLHNFSVLQTILFTLHDPSKIFEGKSSKGGVISESFSLWPFIRKVCQITSLNFSTFKWKSSYYISFRKWPNWKTFSG